MDIAEVKSALLFEDLSPQALFSSLQVLSRYALEHGATDKVALDAIIRFRDLIDKGSIKDPAITDAIYSLCREAGLFPYLSKEEIDWRDRVAFEFFRGPAETSYVFHREQWHAFQYLKSGRSLILSAPTSFGKSILIEAYIAQRRPFCVVVVVPTIALLDQFRRRLSKAFFPTITLSLLETTSP